VGRALVNRRLHKKIQCVMEQRDVGAMSQQPAPVAEPELCDLRFERGPQTALSCDQQTHVGPLRSDPCKCLEEQVEALLRLEPAYGADDEIARSNAEVPACFLFTLPIADERAVIDAVEHDPHARAWTAPPD